MPGGGVPSFPSPYGSPPPNFRMSGPPFPLGPPGPPPVTARPVPGRSGAYGAAASFYGGGTSYNPAMPPHPSPPGGYGGGFNPTYL